MADPLVNSARCFEVHYLELLPLVDHRGVDDVDLRRGDSPALGMDQVSDCRAVEMSGRKVIKSRRIKLQEIVNPGSEIKKSKVGKGAKNRHDRWVLFIWIILKFHERIDRFPRGYFLVHRKANRSMGGAGEAAPQSCKGFPEDSRLEIESRDLLQL